MSALPVALTIAGSDPGGGAGIQADLRTFAAFGVHGASVIAALTAQDAGGVRAIAEVAPAFVAEQLDTVLGDLEVRAVKTGMLHRAAVIDVLVARRLPLLVVDPVMAASRGGTLLEPTGVAALRDRLLPLATLVTPNLHEAEVLTGLTVADPAGMREAARALVALGAGAALVKGGHLAGDAVDVLYDGHGFRELRAPRIEGRRLHGTGCVLSAAIAAGLALGDDLADAVAEAKRYVIRTIEAAPPSGRTPNVPRE